MYLVIVISGNVNWAVTGINGDTLPPGLPEYESMPNLNDGEIILKEKCQKNSHLNNSFDNTMFAKKKFEGCVKDLFDITKLEQEINDAKTESNVDVVFKKYCDKTPEFQKCVLNFTSTIDVCLDPSEKESKEILEGVTEALLSFVCHDDGDRITLFYAEGGADCIIDKKEAIQDCFNTSYSKYYPNLNLSSLPSFKFEENQCRSLYELQKCVVAELQNCSGLTSANIVDSLFKFVQQSTPCLKFKSSQASSSLMSIQSTITLTSLTILVVLLLGRNDCE